MAAPQTLNFSAYETVPLSVTNTSSSVSFALPASATDCRDCMVSNAGSTIAFVGFYLKNTPSTQANFGTTAQLPGITGTLQATPILAGETMVLTKDKADTCIAISSGTTTLYFTAGKGN
jgi:hypothetical protein